MSTIFTENKTLTVIVAVGIFILELEIFAIAAMKSGRESMLEIRDSQGTLVHMADSGRFSAFERETFEKNFGPLDQYQVQLVTKDKPFPFRAWLAAAVGFPIGVLLLFGFCMRAAKALFYGSAKDAPAARKEGSEPATRLERLAAQVSRFNIFLVGALVFLAALAYWVVPNVITYVGRTSLESIVRYKWVFIPLAGALLVLVTWIVWLRYLLAKKSIESQAEVSKYRLALEMGHVDPPAAIDYTPADVDDISGGDAVLDEMDGKKDKHRTSNIER